MHQILHLNVNSIYRVKFLYTLLCVFFSISLFSYSPEDEPILSVGSDFTFEISSIEHETTRQKHDSKIAITLSDDCFNCTYDFVYNLHIEDNKQVVKGLTIRQLSSIELLPGQYFNSYIVRNDGLKSDNMVSNFVIRPAKGVESEYSQRTNCSNVSFTNCNGSTTTLYNVEQNSAYSTNNSYRPCGVQISSSCSATDIDRWHCIDGNLSSPNAYELYSETNYIGVGLSAVTACRINYITCNYDVDQSGVASAIWALTNTGGSQNTIYNEAVSAVPSVNGSQNQMIFYKSNDGSVQDMVEWECQTNCNLNVSAHDGSACPGEQIVLNSNVSGGGSNPSYAWYNSNENHVETIQAENGSVGGGAYVDHVQSNYTGSGYIEFGSSNGEYVQNTVNVPSSGIYEIKIRYAYVNTDVVPMQISINGNVQNPNPTFIGTGSGNSWEEQLVGSFFLNSGNNTIRFTTIANTGVDIDRIVVEGNIVLGTNSTLNVSTAGTYNLIVTKSDGCTSSDSATATFDNCGQSTTDPQDWEFSCADGKQIDIQTKGIKGLSNYTENFANSSNIESVVVEIVYKGGDPGNSLEVTDNNGNIYILDEISVSGNSSSVHVYRGQINSSISSVSFNNIPIQNSAQSIATYIERNIPNSGATSGVFVSQSGYITTVDTEIPIPTDIAERQINITVPVSEITYDCRELRFIAQARIGTTNVGSSETVVINPSSPTNGCCIEVTDLTLDNVSADADNILLKLVSPSGNRSSCPPSTTQTGQSFVLAAAILVDVECIECVNVTQGGTIATDQSTCETSYDVENITNVTLPSGGLGNLEYIWLSTTDLSIPVPDWPVVPGATSESYNPGVVTQDTWFIRCARRSGCDIYEGESNIIHIELNSSPTLDAGQDVEICSGQSITLTVNALGGEPNYMYDWPNGLGQGNSKTVSPTEDITYVVTVTDDNGCQDTDDVSIFVEPNAIVDAGDDVTICDEGEVILFAEVSNIPSCGSGNSSNYCGILNGYANWIESPNLVTTFNDNYGCKLWSGSGQGTSAVTVDCGEIVPAGTSIIVKMKKENWLLSLLLSCKAKIECSLNDNSGFFNLHSGFSFSSIFYNEYQFTTSSSCRYVKLSDIGNAAFSIDHVRYIMPSNYSGVTYSWSGPGIVGSNDGETVTVDQSGEYIVDVFGCNGCFARDTVHVSIAESVNADLGDDLVLCTNDGSATLTTPLIAGATYEWRSSEDASTVIGTTNSLTVSPISETTYTVTVYKDGCEDSDAVTVQLGPTVDAGEDIEICGEDEALITATVSNLPNCGTENSSTGHCSAVSNFLNWIESPSNCATFNDNLGGKLWSLAGLGTSHVTLDCGEIIPAGTKIYTKVKRENWFPFSSKFKLECGTSATSLPNLITGNFIFSGLNYKEYEFTVPNDCRYIRLSDLGSCSFRLDHIRWVKPSNYTDITYSWSGPGIVGPTDGPTITVNQDGAYTVSVSSCDGCITTDVVNVTLNGDVTADIGEDFTLCTNDGSATLTTPLVDGATYEWRSSEDASAIIGTTNSLTVSPTSETTYTVTVQKDGCEDSDAITVQLGPTVDAGEDIEICGEDEALITATVSNLPNCGTENSSTGHCSVVSNFLNWIESPSNCATFNDNLGGKLWSLAGLGTSHVTLDCGEIIPAGTKIYTKVKRENWFPFSSKFKLECGTSATSLPNLITGNFTFNGLNYKEYEFTVPNDCRYIRLSDLGSCSFRLDHIRWVKPSNYTDITYSWSGPGIVGPTDMPTITVNQDGAYTVSVSSCDGCITTDVVNVTLNGDVTADIGEDFTLCTNEGSATLTTPLVDGATYEWRSSEDASAVIGTTNSLTVSPTSETTYTVTVQKDGCEDSDAITVQLGPTVDAGEDIEICGEDEALITATVSNLPNCGTENSSTGHCSVVSNFLNWIESPSNCATFNDNLGGKLWSLAGLGTSHVTLDCGEIIPAGTKIYTKVKRENWFPFSSKFKLECGTSATSLPNLITGNFIFSGLNYKEYEFTVPNDCRYIRLSDLGSCSFRLDHIRWVKPSNYTDITYSWSGPGIVGPTDGPTITVNQDGAYTVSVSSCDGCITTDVVNVTLNDDVTADIGEDLTLCTNDGSATLTTPLIDGATYEWRSSEDASAVIGASNSLTVSPSVETTYTVTVQKNGCEDSDAITVIPNPIVDAGDDVIICEGESYTISPTSTNGEGPYTFFLDGVEMVNDEVAVSPTATTTYTVMVIDAKGCENEDEIVINVTPNPVSGINGINTICAKEDVQFTADAAGAGASYAWTFVGGNPSTASGPSGLSQWSVPGEYEITLVVTKDNCSTEYNTSIVITQEVLAVGGPDIEICQGGDAVIDGGGTPGGNYTWSVESGDPTSIDNGANSEDVSVSPLVTTTYRLTVSQNGCTSVDFVTVVIDVNKNPTADAGEDSHVCEGEDIQLGGDPTGTPPADDPTASLGYIWTGANIGDLNDITISNPIFNSDVPGEYSFDVIVYVLNSGCSDTSSVTIIVDEKAFVGDFTWFDDNYNGVQDLNEVGVNGVSVVLKDANTDDIVGQTVSVSNDGEAGYYQFEVCSGDYYFEFGDVSETIRTVQAATAGNDANDSDADETNGRTPNFNLIPSESKQTIDAGYTRLGTISGFVLEDTDNDDKGEEPIENVTITLTNNTTGAILTELTDENGFYQFVDLIPGEYTVTEQNETELDEDFVDVFDGDESPEDTDDAVDALNDDSIEVTLTPGEDDLDNNFVEEQLGTISGTVLEDTDNDDIGDSPIEGVEITLTDVDAGTSVTATTDGTGFYEFTGLEAGEYRVTEQDEAEIDEDYVDVFDGDESNDGDANDGVLNQDDLVDVTLTAGEDDLNNNFVEEQLGSITGNVSLDDDNDDDADTPQEGVVVTLTDVDTGEEVTTTTDENGDYEFTGLEPGDYTVTTPTTDGGQSVSDEDEDPDGDTADSDQIVDDSVGVTLTPGEDDVENNFVDELLGTISGTVLEDTNNDDIGDSPIEGVEITLTDVDAGTSVTATTNGTGFYEFTDLEAGAYRVTEQDEAEIDEDYVDVFDGDESNDGDANDGVLNQDDLVDVTLTAGEDDLNNNFVEEQLGSITGNVSFDDNNDDDADTPQEGVVVTLTDVDTGEEVTTTTDENGDYEFTGLEPGEYTVTTPTTDGGQSVSDEDEDPDGDTADSDQIVDDSVGVTLTPGEDDVENNFVDELLGTISGTVLEDTNNDDIGDSPIEGVEITLTDVDAGTSVTATTNGTGFYEFTGLEAGEYRVTEQDEAEIDEDFVDVFDGDESNDGDANDGVLNQDDLVDVTLTAGEDDLNNNFVEEQLGSITGNVSLDDNNDDDADTPQEGVVVTLTDVDTGEEVTTTTDENGDYEFTGLEPGDYTVTTPTTDGGQSVSDEDEDPDGDTADSDQIVDDSVGVTLTPGEDDVENNFVDELLGTISGTVLEDTDNDDIGDSPIEGVEITLTDVDAGTSVTATTDGTGFYEFTGLEAGAYRVTEQDEAEIDEDFVDVFDGDESNDGDVNDGVLNQDDLVDVTLTAGEDDLNNNFVEEQLGSITGNVSFDDNNDDDADTPQEGVVVTLTDVDTGEEVTTTTDENGDYEFTGLEPGDYTVTTPTTDGGQSVSDEDEDPDGDTADSDQIVDDSVGVTLTPGEDDVENNFVDELLGTISGTVLEDTDNDDIGDSPIEGVEITLTDVDAGTSVTATTNGTGFYEFTGLEAGAYRVTEQDEAEIDEDYVDVFDGDESNDGDVNDGVLNQDDLVDVTLTAGEDDLNNNFVEEQLGSITGNVSLDDDNDDDADTPQEGVVVTLTDVDTGEEVTTTTDENGDYEFTGLEPGDYTVTTPTTDGGQSVSDEDEDPDGDTADSDQIVDDSVGVTLTPGEDDVENNFVDELLGTISGTVLEDTDNDDIGDSPIEGVEITLTDVDAGTSVTATTNGTGFYEFTGLEAGEYKVTEQDEAEIDEDYVDVFDGDESNDGDANDGVLNQDDLVDVTLTAGEDDLNNNFVEEQLGSITGNVSFDDNNDDDADTPQEGVVVTLTDVDTGEEVTTTTDENGDYEFTGLEPGEYTVTTPTTDGGQSVSDEDEDPDGDTADSDQIVDDSVGVTLTPGEDDVENNFVDELLGTISGTVLEDTDNDDIGDSPIEGVEITLTDVDAGTSVTATTNGTGFYEFTGLEAGEYRVTEQDEAEIDEDFVDVFDGDESNDGDANDGVLNQDDLVDVTLTAGEDDLNNNFVEEQLGSITGNVSFDDNNDDDADTPQEGVVVTLTDVDTGEEVTTTTDENGDYEFTGLEPGDYTVTTPTTDGGQSVSDEDEDPDGDTADSDQIVDDSVGVTLTPGEDDVENNFVDELLGTISGTVLEDTDNDDIGDSPIEGVEITLTDVDAGTSVTATTNGTGFYEFTGLEAGAYRVTEQDEAEIDEDYVDVFDGDESNDGDVNDGVLNQDDLVDVTLTAGEDDLNNNFVEEQLGSITGNVSFDDNNDDDADTPQEGVVVTLTDVDTGEEVTTTTDENGDYIFEGLEPGDYTVTTPTTDGGQSVSDEDEDPDGDTADSDQIVDDSVGVTLTPGEDDTENNFVDELLGTISGTVLEDTDNDDIGDSPIEGVEITLTDVDAGTSVTATTDGTGFYEFTGLEAGAYRVTEQDEAEIDEDFVDVFDGDESNDGDANDGVLNQDDLVDVTLTAGEDDLNNNFVEEQLGSIRGNVSFDDNNDDDADTPQEGVVVTLTDVDTGEEVTTTTDENGDYEFTGLEPGDYTVTTPTTDGGQSVSDEDEDPDGDTADSDQIVDDSVGVTLTPGEDDVENNFVDELLGTISGTVLEDTDNDDIGDSPIEGVEITLTDVDAGTSVTATTDGTGFYEFTGLEAGAYRVTEQDEAEINEDFVDVFDGDESNDGDANDGVLNQDDLVDVTLTAGEDDLNNNFVEEQLGSITGNVSLDDDNDDDADTPQEGVVVTLTDVDTGEEVTTTTDENGDYEFTGLEPGEYTVTTPTTDGGQSVSDEDEDPDGDTADSDQIVDDSVGVTLTPGEDDVENNFVDELLGTISGTVLEDTNNDDIGDSPIEGVEITLTDVDAGTSVTATTNGTGFYEFTGLEAGAYRVTEQDEAEIDEDFVDVFDGDESNDGDVNDGVLNQDDLVDVTLTAGEDDLNNNFVEEQLGSITGNVSFDDNNDDDADTPQEGVVVTLTDVDTGEEVTTTTDENGDYEFTGLEPGEYTVTTPTTDGGQSVSDEDEDPDGDTADSDQIVDDSVGVTLTPGEDDVENNFVDELLGTISGTVLEDTDNDDIGDSPIEGVEITLTDVDAGTSVTATTNGTGFYEFTGLEAGAYRVTEQDEAEIDEDFVDVFDGDESNDGDVNDGVLNQDDLVDVTLTAGEDDLNNNFVEEQLGTISGSVKLDTDNDGDGDTPQDGVEVILIDENGTPIDTVMTNENGGFVFEGVEPGDYTVVTEDPADSQSVSDDDTTPEDATDGDGVVDNTISVTVEPGEDDANNDFVDEELGSISGTVTVDNGDDPNTPLEGIIITLLDDSNNVVDTDTTDVNGDYSFDGIEPGDYTLTEEDPTGYFDVSDVDESTDANDLDGNDGATPNDEIPVVLVAGEDDTDNDFVEELINAVVSVEKLTNGKDADEAPGAFIPFLNGTEASVEWEYVVTNNGNVDLINVSIVDDIEGEICMIDSLAVGESATCDLSGVAIAGQYSNLATVVGQPIDPNTDEPIGDEVMDTDPSNYFGVVFNIDKTADKDTICPGEEVTYEVAIRMVEGLPGLQFRNISFEDNMLSGMIDVNSPEYVEGDDNGNTFLDFGEDEFLWRYSMTLEESSTNIVMDMFDLYWEDEFQFELMASDSATVIADSAYCASLGDYAWYDWNKNGIQDKLEDGETDELAAEGVVVTLFNPDSTIVGTAITDEDGFYEFTELIPGDYFIGVDTNSIRPFGVSPVGQSTDDLDSDIVPELYISEITTLESGENDPTWDVGLFRTPGDIIDPCICKNNSTTLNNGQFDEQIDVQATPGGVWRIIAQTGMYLSSSPAPPAAPISVPLGTELEDGGLGIYTYEFIHIEEQGYTVTVTDGLDTLMISNLCEYPQVVIDFSDELICLYDDPITLPTRTQAPFRGDVTFTLEGQPITVVDPFALGVGVYNISSEVILDADLTLQELFEGGVDTIGLSLCDVNVDYAVEITVSGDCELAQIGDTVWLDTNANGILEDGEAGIEGVEVTLLNSNNDPITEDVLGNEVLPVMSNEDGFYEFLNLTPGEDYRVMFANIDTLQRSPSNTSDDSLDSDADEITGITATYNLVAGERDSTVDAGYFEFASIGDYVWFDSNGNGIQDDDEEGVVGVAVNLLDGEGNPTGQSTTTMDDGFYEFTDLVPGDYQVQFVLTGDLEFTTQDVTTTGATDDNDSDVDPETGLSQVVTLNSGDNDLSIDAGIFELLSLGNLVWIDTNNDGEVNGEEEGVQFVDLALWLDSNGDDSPDMNTGMTAFTDVNGNYIFENLVPGDYIVQVVPSNFQPGGTLENYATSNGNGEPTDPDDNVDNDDDGQDLGLGIGITSKTIELRSADEPDNDGDQDVNSNLTVDFGFFDDASIGNFVWDDVDADGVQDLDDVGINGVRVYLYDANNPESPIDSTFTAENPENATQQGYYVFDGLVPGDYFVMFVTPEGTIATLPNEFGDLLDSDLDDTNGVGTTTTINLAEGEDNMTVDAGFYQTAKVGNYVWLDNQDDIDGKDIQDGSDTGLNGVTVNLYRVADQANPIATLITEDSDEGVAGYYMFEDLKADDYIVEFVTPGDLQFVVPNVGSDDQDSDVVDLFTGRTLSFTLNPADCIEDIDAGFRMGTVPVEWLYIKGEWNQNRDVNEITWATATEINSDYFIIERSYENEGFEDIGKVNSKGNSLTTSSYSFDDEDIDRNGIYYYRLRQVDFDGSIDNSDVVVVSVFRKGDIKTEVYPNPAYGFVNINIETSENSEVQAVVLDVTGKLVMDNVVTGEVPAGRTEIKVPLENLPAGTYVVRISSGENVFNHKILVLNR